MRDEADLKQAERRGGTSLLDVPDAAVLLGIGRTLAYELVRTGRWPTPVIRVGRLIKIPSQPLYDLINGGGSDDTKAS